MNVVIYARYSSDRQTEQSIEGQLKECYEYARRNGYTVVGEYIDRAISGTTDHRPEFLRMIADGDKKLFQAVLVYQLDRFARNRYDSATYKAKLKKNGIRVLSARENISDDASGVLMEAVLEGMAEYYSVELSQKIRRGMDINAEKCLSTGGNLALGFRVDSEKHIQIDPDTAPVVQKIFEMYASGQSMADIIRYLNANHIKTSYGNEFNKNSLNRILRNKRYIGVYTYRGTETPDGLPRIISDDLFYEVQDMMDKKKKAPARAKAFENYILSTKLFCGYCQAAMTGISGTSKTGTKYHYYQCVTNRRDKSCHKKAVSKAYVEDLVIKETRKLLTKENIDRIAKEVVRLCEQEKDTRYAKLPGMTKPLSEPMNRQDTKPYITPTTLVTIILRLRLITIAPKQVVTKTTTPASIPNPIASLRNREIPPVNLPAPLSIATNRPNAINKTAAKQMPITTLTVTFDRKSFFFENP